MRQVMILVLVGTSSALAACAATYHPEYHPVTVTHYTQSVSYPAVVTNAAGPPIVMSVPPPPAPPTATPAEPPEE